MAIKLATKPTKSATSKKATKAAASTSTPPAPPAKVYKLSESKRAYGRDYMRDYRSGIRRRQLKAAGTAAV